RHPAIVGADRGDKGLTGGTNKPADPAHPVVLDGNSLTLEELVRVARDPTVRVTCATEAMERVREARGQIDAITADYEAAYSRFAASGSDADRPTLTYGVTSGFGEFKRVAIPPDQLGLLQKNILLSHAVGVGDNCDESDPANYFSAEIVRAAL